MATETILMEAALRGGDRQELHERIRQHSLAAQAEVEEGRVNPLLDSIADAAAFRLTGAEIAPWIDPAKFTGRSAEQVDEFLAEVIEPLLAAEEVAPLEEPRV